MGNFSDLPAEIMLDIFTRLPTESVLDCKSVSKTWRRVINRPTFTQMHSKLLLSSLESAPADTGKFSFVLKMRDLSEPFDKGLYYVEYDDEKKSHRVKKLSLKLPFELFSIVGSCNGLLCISGLPSHYTEDESSSASYVAYICNPITGESITLPELDRSTYYYHVSFMLSGFGYVASTNEYKVVRLYTFWERNKDAQIEVYTLGSDKGWRSAGKIKVDSGSFARQTPVFINGSLYWNFGKGKTMVFDLKDEVFVSRPEIPEFRNGSLWIEVLGGYLSGTQYAKDSKSSDIWLLKKNENESFSWSKEFSLSMGQHCSPLALTGSGTVLCCSDTKLYLYDPKSSSSKMFKDFGKTFYQGTPHMNSLLSVKTFGKEHTKTLEFGESAIEEPKARDGQMEQ